MGYTLECMVLSKEEYYSKSKEKQVYQLDVYDGNDKVTILDVPKEVYDLVTAAEVIRLEVTIRAYARDGRPAQLLVGFIKLL